MRRLALSLFSHRFLAIARWDLHFLKVRLWNWVSGQRCTMRRFPQVMPDPKYLNLGSGPRGLVDPHWVNIDGFRDKSVHFLLDFSRGLPFDSNMFDGIFCEHVLEHFSQADGESLAKEVFRILRPGGVFRVVVPDAEMVVRKYVEDPKSLVAYRAAEDSAATPMEIVNLFFRQRYEHQFLYDWETMRNVLTRAGFSRIERGAFGRQQLCPAIVLDDRKYSWESLYIEGVKA